MKRALITGATSGIGREMAVYLHRKGWQLVLTGRNAKMLRRMADKFGSGTKYIVLDLAEPGAAERLYEFCKGMKIDFLINNAGFGVFGEFSGTSLDNELAMLDVNIRAVHVLTKLFLRDFTKRDSGVILNVGSSAGFAPGPLMAGYYASKSYVLRLTCAIREELRRKGSHVSVSVLCPGPVDTDFNNRAGVTFSMKPANPRFVAQYGVEGALAGRGILLPGLTVKLSTLGSMLCPEPLKAALIWHIQKGKLKESGE